ncbi:MAG: hypothetical protein ABL897_14875 [Hyphomicrobium sp.]
MAGLISVIRDGACLDHRIFADAAVKHWCGLRWRYLFVREAVEDPIALEAATVRGDQRPPRQRIAERYLFEDQDAWKDEQPDPSDRLINKTTLLVCPGLLNGLLPVREFRDDLPEVAWRYRMRVLRSDSHPARGCEANVTDIMAALSEGKGADAAALPIPVERRRAPGDVMIVAYSKGAPDFFTALIKHPELKSRVKCVFTWAGAIGGSQVADDVASKFKASRWNKHALDLSLKLKGFAHTVMSDGAAARHRIEEFDTVGAVRDLTTPVRQEFLRRNADALDALSIPMFTLRGVTRLSEVPLSQRSGCRLLSGIEPQHDMQVAGTCSKLPLPMATELAVLHGHHWDLAYPAFRKRKWLNNTYHPFPKTAAVTAMVQLAAELGLID